MPKDALKMAARTVGQCAKLAAANSLGRAPATVAEIQVGLGTCGDNLASASRLSGLNFG